MFLRVKACLHGLQKSGAMSRSIQGPTTTFFGAKLSRNNYSTSTDAPQPAGTETKQSTNDKPRFNNNRGDRQFNRNDRPYQNRNQDQNKRFANNNDRNSGFRKFNNNRNERNVNRSDNNNQSQPANPTSVVQTEPTTSVQPQAPSSENKAENSYLGLVGEKQRKNFVANRQRSTDSNQQMRSNRPHNNNFQNRSNNNNFNNGPRTDDNRGARPFQQRQRNYPPRSNNTNEPNNSESQPRAKLLNPHRNKVNADDIAKKQVKVDHPAAPVVIHPANITITSAEKKVFDILAETLKHFKLDTVLRVAGGWVRDKILGNDAGDIDIAVDNLTGVDFATLVQNYLKNHGDEQNLHIVKVNPSKSKHLETAIMHLNDFEVNFNHLRSEEYEANSRIPTATPFGTPLEDIVRRDLTVNSLYYNLSTESIEDFSGQAIADLKAGLLRTTYAVVHKDRLKDADVDPTILEDPLRAVRVVRFASKFDFKIDELLMKSLKHEETKKSLRLLVSPERVGIELDKIFDLPTPKIVRGVTNFHECGLLENIFYPILAADKEKKFQLDLALERTKKYAEIFTKTPELEVYNDLLLGAFVSPVVDKKTGLRAARELCTKLAIRSGRRDSVLHVLQMALEFLPLLDNVNKEAGVIPTEKYTAQELDAKYSTVPLEALGLWLRKVSSQAWALVMYLSRLLRVDSMEQVGQFNDANLYLQEEALMRQLNANDFAFRAISMRPLLTGHDIMSLLELPSSPKIGYYMGKLVLWQINTGKTSREEAQEYLKQLASVDAAQLHSKHPNNNKH